MHSLVLHRIGMSMFLRPSAISENGAGFFGRPPLAAFGSDATRSFANQATAGVGGTGVRSRRARRRSGSRRSSAGYTETGILVVGKSDLGTTTITLLCIINNNKDIFHHDGYTMRHA